MANLNGSGMTQCVNHSTKIENMPKQEQNPGNIFNQYPLGNEMWELFLS